MRDRLVISIGLFLLMTVGGCSSAHRFGANGFFTGTLVQIDLPDIYSDRAIPVIALKVESGPKYQDYDSLFGATDITGCSFPLIDKRGNVLHPSTMPLGRRVKVRGHIEGDVFFRPTMSYRAKAIEQPKCPVLPLMPYEGIESIEYLDQPVTNPK